METRKAGMRSDKRKTKEDGTKTRRQKEIKMTKPKRS